MRKELNKKWPAMTDAKPSTTEMKKDNVADDLTKCLEHLTILTEAIQKQMSSKCRRSQTSNLNDHVCHMCSKMIDHSMHGCPETIAFMACGCA
jgi:hypothetical protein